jgi:uncharacterized membrane protein YqiK
LTKAVSIFPTTDLFGFGSANMLAAELFGFGKEFTGYKNPKTAEREDIVEIPPPKTDFKEKYSLSPKVEIDLSSYFDVETDAEKAAKEKVAAMERKKAEAFARENLAAEEAKAKVAMVEKLEKSSAAREARRLKEEQQAAKEEAKANAAAEREAAKVAAKGKAVLVTLPLIFTGTGTAVTPVLAVLALMAAAVAIALAEALLDKLCVTDKVSSAGKAGRIATLLIIKSLMPKLFISLTEVTSGRGLVVTVLSVLLL